MIDSTEIKIKSNEINSKNNEKFIEDSNTHIDNSNTLASISDESSKSNTSNNLNDLSEMQQIVLENITNQDPPSYNCLSLTVKKDYNLSIVKNVIISGFKKCWKIALSILTLNFLKFFM